MKLHFFIKNQSLNLPSSVLVSDSINCLSADFRFEGEVWKGMSKYAHFQQGEHCFDIMLEQDRIPEEAGLNLTAGPWTVHVHGDCYEGGSVVKRITTNSASFEVQQSGCLEGQPFPSVTVDVFSQMMAAFNEMESKIASGEELPHLFLDGSKPTTKDSVLAEMVYCDGTEEYHAYLKIKCQGSSSMSYPKKNYTVQFFADEARTEALPKRFKGWNFESNKYVLKANYIDHSHSRNIVCARLWNEVVDSRPDYESLPQQLRSSPCNGAIDGFPVKLYYNGSYEGIYTLNIPKDACLWNMDENDPNHVLLCAETNSGDTYKETACNFRALWSGIDGEHWSVEAGKNSDEVKNSLNQLISCVMNSDDEQFKATLGNYLDVQSALDYYIHQYVICGLDGLAKNMLLGTYDLQKWYCGAYDMDSTFLLYWDGGHFVSPTYRCPEDYQEAFSLLWQRLEQCFAEELKERYNILRNSVYSFSNICRHFESFCQLIGSERYAEDLDSYPSIPLANSNNIKQLRAAIRDRLAYTDGEFLRLGSDLLYELEAPLVLDGSNPLDTGVKLFDQPKDFTIFLDFNCGAQSTDYETHLLCVGNHATFALMNTNAQHLVLRQNGANAAFEDIDDTWWGHTWSNVKRMVLVFRDGALAYGKYLKKNNSNLRYIHAAANNLYVQSEKTLILGGKLAADGVTFRDLWYGTVNAFRVYDYALSEEETITIMAD